MNCLKIQRFPQCIFNLVDKKTKYRFRESQINLDAVTVDKGKTKQLQGTSQKLHMEKMLKSMDLDAVISK